MNVGKLYRLKRAPGAAFTSREGIIARPVDGGPTHWLPYDTICMLIDPDYDPDDPTQTDYSEASDMLHDHATNICVLVGDRLFLISHRTWAASLIEEI